MSFSSAGFEIGFPDVAYDADQQTTFQDLIKDDGNSIFAGLTMADVFIYAMALGVKHNTPKPLTKRIPYMPPEAFSENMRWLMRSVAILDSEDLEIFIDHSKVVKIAETFANGGMQYLLKMINERVPGEDIESIFETALRKEIKNS